MEIEEAALGMLDHETRKVLEAKGRVDAESDSFMPPHQEGEARSYQHGLLRSAICYVYTQAFSKRKARLERLKSKVSSFRD